MREKNKKILDIALIILLPIIATILALYFRANFLITIILFLGMPALWLSLRTPKAIQHTFIFSLVFSFIGWIIIDPLAVLDKAWYVPTIFPFRIFGAPVEDFIWSFAYTYLIIIFYEHFFDKGKHNVVDKRFKYFLYIFIPAMILFLTGFYWSLASFSIPYFYLWMNIFVCFIPIVLFFSSYKSLITKVIKLAVYFFFLGIIHELTALELGHWAFPGVNFVGWVTIAGYAFPYEEFVFGMLLFAAAVIAYYDFFDEPRYKLRRK